MAKRKFSEYDHVPIHWLPEFKEDYDVLLDAWQKCYGIDRWNSPESLSFKYGVYKSNGLGKKEVLGVFDNREEVIGLLRFLLATAEKES